MESSTQKNNQIFDLFIKHPYIVVSLACLLLLPFGFGEKVFLRPSMLIYASIAVSAISAALIFLGKLGETLKERLIIFGGFTAFTAAGLYLIQMTGYSVQLILVLPLIYLAVIAAMLRSMDRLDIRMLIGFMIIAGILVRFIYVLYTDSGSRQHDVGFWNWTWGHSNYIEYWYNNGLKLPDFDVRTIWQYYHPPLHHWLMALLLRILTSMGVVYETACQALQLLPMLYSSLIMVVSYRIFRCIRLKGVPLLISMLIVCFHPTFIIFAGAFNNDILSVLFMLGAILWALRWYRKPKLINILPIALCVGLGMMTKLSAWMVAPAIALIFLIVFFKNLKKWLYNIGQFALFLVICAPLALWWQVRNLIMFNVPLTYVPYLGDQNVQYLGGMSVWQRLFDFTSQGTLSFVYDGFTDYGAPFNEYNPTLGLLKTSLFDEGTNGINDLTFPQIKVIGPILFWIGAVLALVGVVMFFYAMISKKTGLDRVERLCFVVLFATLAICFYAFCFKFPFTCTMNIRYCMPLIQLTALGIGLTLTVMKNKYLRIGMYALCGAFATVSTVMFAIIG